MKGRIMPYMDGLQVDAKVHNALIYFNTGMERPLLKLQQVVMRSPDSPLEVAERELLAAYVSALNKCKYCRGVHTACAEAFGVKKGLVGELVDDLEKADIEERLKPIFRFARKLTLAQHEIGQDDVQAIYDAGWSERALYDAVCVCCTFNFMNRFTIGLGLSDIPAEFEREGQMLKQVGYGVANLLKLK
ncbi:MAG: peroxidase-related enzyme [Rhizobiaceae bacterium]